MKFLQKNLIFINWSKKGRESVLVDYFRCRNNDGHLKIRLNFSKTMINNYDVINKRLTKGDQKRFSGSHWKPVFKKSIPLEFWCDKAVDNASECSFSSFDVFYSDKWLTAHFIPIAVKGKLSMSIKSLLQSFCAQRSHQKRGCSQLDFTAMKLLVF